MTSTPAWRVRAATADDLPALSALLARDVAPAEPPLDLQWLAQDGQGGLLGTLRLRAGVGLQLPRVSYHVGCVVHAARELGLFHRQRTLLLGHDHTGACELTDIAWRRDAEPAVQAGVLQALVAAALAALRADATRFGDRLIVELPGRRDTAAQSPFWDGLGRHFYAGDPASAWAQHGPDWRSHVASMLPRQPVYTAFLPAVAQAVIGEVDESARVLESVLHASGLRAGEHVNVEDGGPILEARVSDLPALRG